MNTKLTLSINPNVIDEAKVYAKSNGRSLSSIVEEYLKSLVTSQSLVEEQIYQVDIIQELKGSVKMPKEFISYKSLLQDALMEKYFGNE